jgi:hypothetical protein
MHVQEFKMEAAKACRWLLVMCFCTLSAWSSMEEPAAECERLPGQTTYTQVTRLHNACMNACAYVNPCIHVVGRLRFVFESISRTYFQSRTHSMRSRFSQATAPRDINGMLKAVNDRLK